MSVLAIVLFIAITLQIAVCDGHYDLTVELDAALAARTKSISYIAVHGEDTAKAVIAAIRHHDCRELQHQNSAAPIIVPAGFSYRVSWLGSRWGDVQYYSHLIVVLSLVDGSEEVHCLTIPHRDITRQIVVNSDSLVDILNFENAQM